MQYVAAIWYPTRQQPRTLHRWYRLILLAAACTTAAMLFICILHCHLVQIERVPAQIVVAGQAVMICHTPGDAHGAGPYPLDFAQLQSITYAVPSLAPGLAAIFVLLALLPRPLERHGCSVPNSPEPPPPRPLPYAS
ncbi:MAG: hypothetical protein HC911_06570 [Chloroflexaceae bacterium]|nr:hypothetical protein [Chloroflexaceae bacterium]